MAELLLKIGDVGPDHKAKDGDVVAGCTSLETKDVHAYHVCHPRNAGFNGDGLRPADGLFEQYLKRRRKFRMEVVSSGEVKRVDLATGDETIVRKDVRRFVRKNKRHPLHQIFGSRLKEYWYTGNKDLHDADLTAIWQEIESRTGLLESDHRDFPWGREEKKHFLIVPIKDVTPQQLRDWREPVTEPYVDEDGITRQRIVTKHAAAVDYRNSLSISSDTLKKIEERSVAVDKPSSFVYEPTVASVK